MTGIALTGCSLPYLVLPFGLFMQHTKAARLLCVLVAQQSLRPSFYDLETIEKDWERTRGYARRIAKPPIL